MIPTPGVSIIMPVFHESSVIHDSLESLGHLVGITNAEVILVDGGAGSTVDSVCTAHYPYTIRTCVSPPGRGRQLAEGAELSTAPHLVFLHVDTRIRRDALLEIGKILSRHAAGAFDLYVRSSSYYIKTVAAFASVRSRLTRIPYGDQVHFVRKEIYVQIGGYREMPIMEDVEFMSRLKRHGHRIKFTRSFAANPDRRWRKEGPVRRTLANWSLMLAYRLGVSASRLSSYYKPHAAPA